MFDVIVIGGNLAGANAAINASKKSVNVALIERNKKPFFPAHCGEAIPDIWAKLINLDKIGCPINKIKNIILNVSSHKEYILSLKKYKAFIFDRNFVENYLLKEAEKKGVELMLGVSMKDFKPPNDIFLNNNKSIKGRVIIDASGISCQVGRRIGLDTKLKNDDIGVCIQSRIHGNFISDTLKIWFHKPYAPFGYAWLFPIDNKTANIGLGTRGGQKLNLAKLLDKYIEDTIKDKYKISHTFKACVPIAPPMSRLIKDNVMIVGDAARLVNSEWGCGIGHALFSGGSAGITAAKFALGEIDSLEQYQDSMKTRISRLRKANNRKKKLKSEKKFISKYRRNFSILSSFNRLCPDSIQDYISKVIIEKMI